jgi:hypothetical protein
MPSAPEGSEFMELVTLLPPEWPVSQKDFNDEANWWPLRELKALGRFPHEYATWFGYGHTIGHGDPPAPFHESTHLCGSLISAPFSLPPDFYQLSDGNRVTHFYCVCPLYAEEMQFKLDEGLEELLELFDRYDIGNVIDPRRINVVTGRIPNLTEQTSKSWWKLWKR